MFVIDKINELYGKYKINRLQREADKRKITDISDFCYSYVNIPNIDFIRDNWSYGHAYHLKKYAQIPQERALNCTIEHGLDITTDVVDEIHASYPVKKILTFSDYRKEVIERNTNMTAIPIGPYIAYAEDYMTGEEMEKLKSFYGKILLVFPSHGYKGYDIKYDAEMFSKKIDELASGFHTVFVCLSAYDIINGMAQYYQECGYTIVSAGLPTDKFFLCRQRLIFQLANAVCSNSFTTGLSYALYFDKPIYLFRQKIEYECKSMHNESQLDEKFDVLDELFSICRSPNFDNLDEQKKWADYYFGLSKVKNKENMKDVLETVMR